MNLVVQSSAKINWTLAVLGKRPDKFHELESLVWPVTLYDELSFETRDEPGFSLSCDDPSLPLDDRNLVVRAARNLADKLQHEAPGRVLPGVYCKLSKSIPVGGGLGGGSSNAAATLRALQKLWSVDWPAERFHKLAAELGSDVPLFLHTGPVVMRGRGERVEPVTLHWPGWIVLIFPGIFVSTAEVYRAWSPDVSGPHHSPTAAEIIREFTRPGVEITAVSWLEAAYNHLEQPALRVSPALADIRERCMALAARPVRLSGSGSTFFTAFDTRAEAETFAEQVQRRVELGTRLVRLVN